MEDIDMPATNAVRPFGRNYSGGQQQAISRFTARPGDPQVEELYLIFTNFPAQTAYWEFHKKVLACAIRLFSGNYNWFILQDNNSNIDSYNYQFLLDTVRYIATGHRRISITQWPMLLATEPDAGAQLIEPRAEIATLFNELKLDLDTVSMIQNWVKHKNGMNDLMYTLHLLFGSVEVIDKD
ncbi:virion structural protein [Pseudomonas phage vB_PaePAO1-KEN19]